MVWRMRPGRGKGQKRDGASDDHSSDDHSSQGFIAARLWAITLASLASRARPSRGKVRSATVLTIGPS